jgi:DNA polymerase-3 subunit gamma/tau
MSYQVLARKWRPKQFKQVVGQEAVVQALVNGLDNDRVHHAFLLTGTRGVGKTTLARILAKCLNCETGVSSTPCGECGSCSDVDDGRFVDMLEIDAASRTKVDDTRELLETVQYAPTRGRYKVYIIDEVHMLSGHSFNALLKTLEEPPPHVKFVLATTDADKIPVTILSRCLRFNLRRLLPEQISAHLEEIVSSEGVQAESAAIERIARAADGSMRDGLSLLDQAIAYGGGQLADAEVAQMLGSVDHAHLAALIGAVADEDGDALLEIVRELAAQARDLESVLVGLAEILHRVCLVHCVPDYKDPERSDWESITELAARVGAEDAQLFYQIAIQGARDLGMAPDPRTGLEMALLRMLAFRPAQGAAPAEPGSGGKARESAKDTERGEAGKAIRAQRAVTAHAAIGEPQPVASEADNQSTVVAGDGGEWASLVERLDLSGPVKELARNIQLRERSGDQWSFVIPKTVSHYGSRSMMQKLESALAAQLGQPVRLVLATAASKVQTPAAAAEDATRKARGDAEQAILRDETVRSLQDRMGATIIEDSVQPLQ